MNLKTSKMSFQCQEIIIFHKRRKPFGQLCEDTIGSTTENNVFIFYTLSLVHTCKNHKCLLLADVIE